MIINRLPDRETDRVRTITREGDLSQGRVTVALAVSAPIKRLKTGFSHSRPCVISVHLFTCRRGARFDQIGQIGLIPALYIHIYER